MLITRPNRDADFRCLASACPDTCCAGWEIPVDEVSADRFRAMEDAMGARLRRALICVDGETQFARVGGRCVLLNGNNLCDLYAVYGEGALCRTCRLHPRFVAEYGARREIMPGLSCPEWIAVYLKDEAPVTFITEETAEPITSYTDIDAALFFKLYKGRNAAFSLLQDRALPIGERMIRLLELGEALDGGAEAAVSSGAERAYVRKLQTLERLTPAWSDILNGAGFGGKNRLLRDGYLEKILVYDVFRFFLRGVYDGRVLPWVKQAVFHALVIGCLTANCTSDEEICEVIRLYSKELEHNSGNMDALHRVLCRRSGRYSAGTMKACCRLLGNGERGAFCRA